MFIYFNLLLFYYADDFLRIGYAYWMRTGGCEVSSIAATPAMHGNTVHDDGYPPQQGFFARDEREQELERPHQITRATPDNEGHTGKRDNEWGPRRRGHGKEMTQEGEGVDSRQRLKPGTFFFVFFFLVFAILYF